MFAINTVAKTKRIFATLVRIVFVFTFYVVCRLSFLLTCGEVLPCQRANSVQVILFQFLLLQGKRYAALLVVFSLMSRETILNHYGHEQK